MNARTALLIIALAAWTAAAPAQTSHPLTGSGTSDTTNFYAGGTFDYAEYEAVGELTVLGPVAAVGWQFVHCADQVIVEGEVAFSDAAGGFNTLTVAYVGVGNPDGSLSCYFTVTGGTGRFEGAGGEGALFISYSPQHPFDFELDGVLWLP